MRHNLHPISAAAVPAIRVPTAGSGKAAELWRKLARNLFDPYRPELHYMRGPGPKWRERHAGAAAR
jgi:hypothetical protein